MKLKLLILVATFLVLGGTCPIGASDNIGGDTGIPVLYEDDLGGPYCSAAPTACGTTTKCKLPPPGLGKEIKSAKTVVVCQQEECKGYTRPNPGCTITTTHCLQTAYYLDTGCNDEAGYPRIDSGSCNIC
ncbi:hypothetical protein HZA57_00475 [Candidatus Poribacteria bacterium]|nr:hypothetical protein [Candidatus Poribacteria bacterium]